MTSLARLALLLGVALAVACGSAAGPAPAAGAVTYQDRKADPAQLNVVKGQSATWTNKDTTAHTVTSGKDPNSKTAKFEQTVEPGQSVTIKFDEAGTFDYFCARHSSMRNFSVVVK